MSRMSCISPLWLLKLSLLVLAIAYVSVGADETTKAPPAITALATEATQAPGPSSNPTTLESTSPAHHEHQMGNHLENAGKIFSKALNQGLQLIDGFKSFIDLSHPLENATLHWPANPGFSYISYKDGDAAGPSGAFYVKSDGFTTAVHTGTHLDAPRHFSKTGWTVDQIPLERLLGVPVRVIDLSSKVKQNKSYSFMKEDFIDPQTKKSLLIPKSVLLVYTGISETYPQGEKAYLGTDNKNISEMQIPGFSEEAARYIVEQEVYGVGLDSPSADSSAKHSNGSLDPVAHVVFCAHNVYILENVNSKLASLIGQDTTTRLMIAPLPLVGGSGSPIRLVAVTGFDLGLGQLSNSAQIPGAEISLGVISLSLLFVGLSLVGRSVAL